MSDELAQDNWRPLLDALIRDCQIVARRWNRDGWRVRVLNLANKAWDEAARTEREPPRAEQGVGELASYAEMQCLCGKLHDFVSEWDQCKECRVCHMLGDDYAEWAQEYLARKRAEEGA